MLAGASPYCLMFGGVAAGAMMAESGTAAITAGDRHKQATCRFYLEQLLPLSTALHGAVTGGEEVLFDIGAADL